MVFPATGSQYLTGRSGLRKAFTRASGIAVPASYRLTVSVLLCWSNST
jgi:hypothetical protein